MTEHESSSEVIIEIYQNLTNLRGLSMGLNGYPRITGCGLFWESRDRKPWRQEGNTLLLSMLQTEHTIKGIVEVVGELFGETGLVVAMRLTRVEWPDTVKFLGTSKSITEFQAGFFEVFAHAVAEAPARHYRNHWGE